MDTFRDSQRGYSFSLFRGENSATLFYAAALGRRAARSVFPHDLHAPRTQDRRASDVPRLFSIAENFQPFSFSSQSTGRYLIFRLIVRMGALGAR